MKLNQRLTQAGKVRPEAEKAPAGDPPPPKVPRLKPVPGSGAGSEPAVPGRVKSAADPMASIKQRAQESLYGRLGGRLFRPDMTEDQLQRLVKDELTLVLQADRAPLSPAERQRLLDDISEDVLGYGPIEGFLADPEITEIMVNGTRPIYVERAGKLYATPERFFFEDHLRRVIERIVGEVGRRIDESSPMVDARLPDGSRVNAIIPPLALDGPSVTIRKFAKDPYQVADLIRMRTLTPKLAELMAMCVAGKLNILVTGGTGTGKTTLLNVLSSFIPENERIVTIEDSAELQLHQDHVVRLEGRPSNIEGRGEVTIRDLVRNALRMRPDRIIVGEVRGGEALDMLQAMNTGHEGSLSTLHANSPRDALARIETMVLMAGIDLPSRAIREQVASAIHLVLHLSRLRDGTRRVTHVTEVTAMQGDTISLQDIFLLEDEGLGDDGLIHGSLVPTGIRPAFADHLKMQGFPIPGRLLGGDPLAQARKR